MGSPIVVHVQGWNLLDLHGVTIRIDYEDCGGTVQAVLLDGTVVQIESRKVWGGIVDALVDLGWQFRCAKRIAASGHGGVVCDPPRVPPLPLDVIDEPGEGG